MTLAVYWPSASPTTQRTTANSRYRPIALCLRFAVRYSWIKMSTTTSRVDVLGTCGIKTGFFVSARFPQFRSHCLTYEESSNSFRRTCSLTDSGPRFCEATTADIGWCAGAALDAANRRRSSPSVLDLQVGQAPRSVASDLWNGRDSARLIGGGATSIGDPRRRRRRLEALIMCRG